MEFTDVDNALNRLDVGVGVWGAAKLEVLNMVPLFKEKRRKGALVVSSLCAGVLLGCGGSTKVSPELNSKGGGGNVAAGAIKNDSRFLSGVKTITAKVLERDAESIRDHARFKEDLNCDSLDTAEIIMMVEDEFNIRVTDADELKFVAVSDLAQFAEKAPRFKAKPKL